MLACAPPVPHRAVAAQGAARSTRHRLKATHTDAQFDALREWVHARGGYVSPSLHLGLSEDGRELHVCGLVSEGTLLACLPRACCLSLDVGGRHDDETWPARMAHLLLATKEKPSDAPLTALWPPTSVPVGLLAPWPVLQLLGDTLPDVRDAAAGLQLSLEKDRHCSSDSSVADEDWEWALSLALSRVARPDGCPFRLLAPVFDMANHSGGAPDLEWRWCAQTNTLQMHAAKELSAGPVRISYGSTHGNTELWLGYGVVVECNENDTIALWSDQDELASWLEEHMGDSEHRQAAEFPAAPEEACGLLLAGRHGALHEPLHRWMSGQASGRDAIHRRAQQLVYALDRGLEALDDAQWRSANAEGVEFLPSLRRLLAAKRLMLNELITRTAPLRE